MVGDVKIGSRYSVTGSVLARKLKVAVILPNDDDCNTLVNQLKRMGFLVQVLWPVPKIFPSFADLIFVSFQPDERDLFKEWDHPDSVPLIAILTYENPSFIDYALKLGAQAIIMTPIRPSGILSVITVCMQRFRDARRQADRIRKLEIKLQGVMQLAEAKAILMRMHGINEAEAYEILRSQAMCKRVSIDEMSQSVIQANDIFSSAAPSLINKN